MVTDVLYRAAAVALLAPVIGCGDAGGEAAAERELPLVEALAAREGALPIEEVVPGEVRARNQVEVRPEVAGRVVAVPIEIGAAVERGSLLVRLDDAEARERLRQAEADLRLAEASVVAARARAAEAGARRERTRALAAAALVSEQQLDTLEAEVAAAVAGAAEAAARVDLRRAEVAERRSALAKTGVRSPVAGRVGERRAEVGMRVDPATVLFVVGDLDRLVVQVHLTEAMLAAVDEGTPALLEGGAAGADPIAAALSRISPFLAPESFSTVGEIDVAKPPAWLRPGTFVNVRLLVGESQRATLVPVTALFELPGSGGRGVFVVEGDPGAAGDSATADDKPLAIAFRPVEVLAEGRGAAGVAGIEPGAWVVTVGQHLLAADLPDTAAAGGAGPPPPAIRARVRPVAWERVMELQNLQDEDLLEGFLAKQRQVAAALGAEIPASEDEVDRVLEASAAAGAGPGGS